MAFRVRFGLSVVVGTRARVAQARVRVVVGLSVYFFLLLLLCFVTRCNSTITRISIAICDMSIMPDCRRFTCNDSNSHTHNNHIQKSERST